MRASLSSGSSLYVSVTFAHGVLAGSFDPPPWRPFSYIPNMCFIALLLPLLAGPPHTALPSHFRRPFSPHPAPSPPHPQSKTGRKADLVARLAAATSDREVANLVGGSDDDDWGSSDEDWVAQQQEAKTPGRSAAVPPPSPQRRIRPTNIRPGLAASTKVTTCSTRLALGTK